MIGEISKAELHAMLTMYVIAVVEQDEGSK